jgi:hypothetical protein
MRNRLDRDCNACWMKDCECECKTCVDARERNEKLSRSELYRLNIEDIQRRATLQNETEETTKNN